jgi:membrane protein YdbS with pleckstrin-like domain
MSGVKLGAAEAPRQLAKLLAKSKLRHHCPLRNRPAYSSWPVEALACGRVIVGAPRERHLFDVSLEQVAQAFDVPNGLAGIAHRDELHPDRRSYVIGPLGMGIVELMARYIDDILQPEEKVLYSTNAHWTFYVPAIVTWVAAIIVFILSRSTTSEWLVLLYLGAAALLALVALYLTVKAWFHRWTTETDVTNLRVVHKTGFIQRRTFEIALDKVESVDVNQSMLGRILNYGNVTIKGIGEGRETAR